MQSFLAEPWCLQVTAEITHVSLGSLCPPFRPSPWAGLQGDPTKAARQEGGSVWSWRGRGEVSNFLKYKWPLFPSSSTCYCENFQTPKSSENFTVSTHISITWILALTFTSTRSIAYLAIQLPTHKPSYFSDAFLHRLQTSVHSSKHLSPQEPMEELANNYFAT